MLHWDICPAQIVYPVARCTTQTETSHPTYCTGTSFLAHVVLAFNAAIQNELNPVKFVSR
jgi:hypothetical protein